MGDWEKGSNDGQDEVNELNDKGIEEYNQGNYDKAQQYYEWAIEKDPDYKWAYYNLGLLYKTQEKYDLAIEFYHKALKIDPKYADAYNGLGVVYYARRDYSRAKDYYLKAIKYDDQLQYPYFNMGLIMDKENNPTEAKDYYKKAIEVNPNYAKAHNSLGICYYNEEKYDQAMDHYKKSIDSDSSVVYPYYNIALIYEKKMDWKNAWKWHKKALEVDPNYRDAIEGLKYVEKQMGEIPSEEDLKEENETKPEGFLERFGRNLNAMAEEGKLVEPVGRNKEIQNVLEILYKRIKNNPILVGHPGVGKTAIVEGLAKKIADKKVPDFFHDKEIIELNVGTLVAGTTYRGQMEQKIKTIIEEVKNRKNVIVFLDEIHTLVGAGRTEGGSLDIAQMLKPVLARGEFPCIGATTYAEYQKYFEKDAALERRFYPVRIDELSPEATIKVLHYLKPKVEEHYGLSISDENIDTMVELTDQHVKKRYFPDKAIDVMEKTASRCALEGLKEVTGEKVKEIISESTGTQFLETTADESSRLMEMEDFLKSQIMGQDDVIERVASLVRMAKRRLDLKPERPDGVFLFTGPSGVGKTELAKQLCVFLYGNEKKLIKLDMTEFSESHSISKLIGSPPGYVGYENQAYLSSQIEEHPSSILVLDEIEKAHPDVVKLFLQVFDEGKMKDSRGRTVVFSDVTIIMTSNIIKEWKPEKSMGFGTNENETSPEPSMQQIADELSKFFPMEFLNRIDEIVLFHSLSESDLKKIVELKIIQRAQEIFARQQIELNFESSLIDEIISSGYSADFGARNLERTFESIVLRPLSNEVFSQEIKAGAKLSLDWKKGELLVSQL